MMVIIKINELTATWDGNQWTSADPALVGLLSAYRDESAGYWPDEANARAMCAAALGRRGWRVIRSDPQPVEPGVVY